MHPVNLRLSSIIRICNITTLKSFLKPVYPENLPPPQAQNVVNWIMNSLYATK